MLLEYMILSTHRKNIKVKYEGIKKRWIAWVEILKLGLYNFQTQGNFIVLLAI